MVTKIRVLFPLMVFFFACVVDGVAVENTNWTLFRGPTMNAAVADVCSGDSRMQRWQAYAAVEDE